jgi:hypothetical protein
MKIETLRCDFSGAVQQKESEEILEEAGNEWSEEGGKLRDR